MKIRFFLLAAAAAFGKRYKINKSHNYSEMKLNVQIWFGMHIYKSKSACITFLL